MAQHDLHHKAEAFSSSSPCSLAYIFMQWGRCHHDRDQEMCTAGGQNVHRGLINLKAADNRWCRGNGAVCKVEGQLGRREPLTLERPSSTGVCRLGVGEWNVEFLAVIYSGKNGAVILSYKLESYYF